MLTKKLKGNPGTFQASNFTAWSLQSLMMPFGKMAMKWSTTDSSFTSEVWSMKVLSVSF
jgi:hypothetical protein